MLIKKSSFQLIIIASFALVTAACSWGNGGKATSSEPGKSEGEQVNKFDMSKPLELTFYSELDTTNNDDDFMKEFGQYLQKKYPNVTFKKIYSSQTKKGVEPTIAAGVKFDLAQMSPIRASIYVDLEIGTDISDLIKKHSIDMSGVDPIALQQLKDAAGGKLIGLPYQGNSQILFYNKAIFDKFGVAYPKDGMTWQDVTDITRKVTRLDSGIQYTGLGLQQRSSIFLRSNQLSIEPIDLKTKKVTFGNSEWKRLFDEFMPIFQIQGNKHDSLEKVDIAFIKDQSVAMALAYPNFYTKLPASIDWDIVSAPSLKEKPGVAMPPIPSTLVINSNSPFRDEAFLVAMAMLSKDVQMDRAKNYAFASVLTDPEIKKVIGTGLPELKGKNTPVMQPSNMARSITFTPYTAEVMNIIGRRFNEVMSGTRDTNTALREAEEVANKYIADRIAAEGK